MNSYSSLLPKRLYIFLLSILFSLSLNGMAYADNFSLQQATETSTDPVFTPEERKIEILTHLAIGLKYSPNNFRSIAGYRRAYNYSGRSLDEKRTLIDFWNLTLTKGSLEKKMRAKAVVSNIGIGLRDTPQAYESHENFKHMYEYSKKTEDIQSILDRFWRMTGK